MSRNYLKRGIGYLRRNGLSRTVIKACERLTADRSEADYVPYHADEAELLAQRQHVFEHPYMFSILVPVYNTDPKLFADMVSSVTSQTYGNWELILADASPDESRRNIVRDEFGDLEDKIKYVRVAQNRGISANSNEALAHATGDYVGLLDHDDILENTALFDIMSAIEERERELKSSGSYMRVMSVYTDEDKISEDGSRYFNLHKKPGPDPVLLATNNYVCHFFVADTGLVKSVGGFRSEYDGAQDHDLILRCFEGIKRTQIVHVPKVLYHWRSTSASTAENPDAKLYAYEAGRHAVSDHFKRAGLDVAVKDSAHLGFFEIGLPRLHKSVFSTTPEKLEESAKNGGFVPDSEFIMVLSDDLRPLDGDYIADMMSCMNLDCIGAVTGRIIASNSRTESAGFDIDAGGAKVPRFAGLYRLFSGYMHRASLDQLVSAFSTDCVLLRKDAVEDLPSLTLKDGYDIYYLPKAVFKRKSR